MRRGAEQRWVGHGRRRISLKVWVRLGLIAIVWVWLTLASPVWAASASLSPDPVSADATAPNSSANASAVPSETVSRFVSAYLGVVRLIESREQSLQGAETETESRQMQQEVQAEAVALIQSHDLTLQAYWELLGLANSDPEFRERVLAQIEEASP